MPQITVDVKAIKNTRTNTVNILVQQVKNNQRQNAIVTTQHLSEIGNATQLAEWILQQTPPSTEPDHEINRRLIIDFHTEQVEDEDGQFSTIKVLDSIDNQSLPENKAKNEFNQSPIFTNGFSGISDFINSSVTDLPTAKQALTELAKACFYLQVQLNNGGD